MAAQPGIIPFSGIPSPVPAGLYEACENALTAAGFSPQVSRHPDGVHVSDVPTVNGVLASYVGSASQVAWLKTNPLGTGLLDKLDLLLNANAQLPVMIAAGTSTTLTGTQVGNFLAQVTNNYRTLRASINAATTVSALNAININAGWPANP